MLGDGSDELLSGEELRILLVLPMSHAGAIEDFAGILNAGNLDPVLAGNRRSVRSKQPVGNDGMKMRVEPGIISEEV